MLWKKLLYDLIDLEIKHRSHEMAYKTNKIREIFNKKSLKYRALSKKCRVDCEKKKHYSVTTDLGCVV